MKVLLCVLFLASNCGKTIKAIKGNNSSIKPTSEISASMILKGEIVMNGTPKKPDIEPTKPEIEPIQPSEPISPISPQA